MLNNGCQEVVSKGGLDRFVKQFQTSIRLTFNTLEAHNKNQQLSRGSKCKPAQMFKNEGPMNPDFGEITQQLCTLINDNLEAMAKQLYDYWFVQFDFPNEEGKPYKSSGGAMMWNEKLKREIPQGWSDCVLGDYIGRITNGLNPRKNFVLGSGNNYYVTIRSLVGTTIDWNNCDRCDDEALSKINSRSQLQIGDIIFSAIGTIGRTYYILEEPTNWNISETSFTLRAKENVPNDFFYGMLRSNEIQIKADKAAMGSTLRCLVMDSLCSLQYIEIPNYMMKLFADKVSPLYRQIHRNNKEIAELTKQRDELLPLLMNGQASVNSD